MITVVLPVRDGERYLDAAIQSILQQTCSALELIVVDDGSTDRSAEIADSYARQDRRVRLIRLEPRGLPKALNAGLDAARHDWIARMDADDVSYPERLDRQLAAASVRPDVLGWGTWAHGIDSHGEVRSLIARGPTSVEEFRRQHRRGVVELNHATMLLRRDALMDAGGYDPRFDRAEDVELWDRLGEQGPLLTVPEPLYGVRIRATSHHAEGIARGLEIGRFVAARRQARERGATLTFAEFVAMEERRGALRRALRQLYVRGRIHHYRATTSYFERRFISAALNLAAAMLLAPLVAVPRALRQLRRRLSDSTGRTRVP